MPLNAEGKIRGFAFVQYNTLAESAKAVSTLNRSKLLGRPIAVDWSLPKDDYTSREQAEQKAEATRQEEGEDIKQDDKDDDGDDAGDDDMQIVQASSSEDDDDDEEEEDGEEGSEGAQDGDMVMRDGSDDEEGEEGSDEESDEGDDEEDGEDDEEAAPKKKARHIPRSTDVHDGTTVFLQNVSFQTTGKSGCECMWECVCVCVYICSLLQLSSRTVSRFLSRPQRGTCACTSPRTARCYRPRS